MKKFAVKQLNIQANTPAAYISLVTRCWDQDSKKRPSADASIAELNNLKQTEAQRAAPSYGNIFSN